MKTIRARLALSAGLIFVLVSVTSFFLVFGTHLNNTYLSNEQVVEERVDALEHLSVSVYRYLKHVAYALLSGEFDDAPGLVAQYAAIRQDLDNLDATYAPASRERFPAADEALARNREIRALLDHDNRTRHGSAIVDGAPNGLREPTALLDADVELAFRDMIRAAIDDERRQLQELRSEYKDTALVVVAVSTVLSIAVAFVTLLILYLLYESIKRPLGHFTESTHAIRDGNYDARVEIEQPAEYANLAASFNEMATKLEIQTEDLVRSRDQLEREVAKQTLELQRKNVQLEALDESRKQLLLDVGHELRTPLTVVQGEVEIALREKDADRNTLVAALERIADVVSGINRLVVDLFTIVRADFEPNSISMKRVNYRTLLGELYDAVVVLASRKSISVAFDQPAHDLPGIADADRIKQAVTAILDNAVRYSDRGSRIMLGHAESNARIVIEVIDEGIGIKPEEIDRVFDRFYRSDAAKRYSAQGSGLGLAVAAKIIEQHNGSLTVAPNPAGRGTRVEITLPLTP
ncbi:MAG: sensor histidine kinase [Proteobacteria bacterium]|nr:MAG: sensor histidine kinase [Pseudomonadota bacterium]